MDNRTHRLYFGIRYLMGGIISNIIILGSIAVLGKIDFVQAVILISIAIITALISCTKMNKKIIRLTYRVSKKLERHPRAEKIIFKLV